MSRSERLFVYPALLALVFLALAAGTRARTDPPAARVATCDIYQVMRLIVGSERYRPARQAEQDKVKGELKQLAERLRALEQELKAMDAKDAKAQETFQEYNDKKQLFAERQASLDDFVGTQFVEAYELARQAVDTVAERRGYTHVLATRKREERPSGDLDRITQQLLSRPVLRSPAGDDITEDVQAELKL